MECMMIDVFCEYWGQFSELVCRYVTYLSFGCTAYHGIMLLFPLARDIP